MFIKYSRRRYGPGTWFTDQSRYMVYSFVHLWAPQGGAHMPWNETSAMDQRMHFIADFLEDYFPFSELCRRYGISRPTGYKWVQRYVDTGAAGLMAQSRRPVRCPHALGRLSQLSVWWIRLGILPERIQPGCPQQNGRHERMHGTLKREATIPPPRVPLRTAIPLYPLPSRIQPGTTPRGLGTKTSGPLLPAFATSFSQKAAAPTLPCALGSSAGQY